MLFYGIQKEDTMKHFCKVIALLLVAVMLTAALAACGESTPNGTTPAGSGASKTEAARTDTNAGMNSDTNAGMNSDTNAATGSTENAAQGYLDVTGIDFTNPSIVIAYDDYDGMQDLAKKMQNFEIPADTVVEINGEVGASMMTHSIVVPNADGSQRIGTTFEVVGGNDADIPADGTQIHIIGVVRQNDNSINVLVVPAEQFEVPTT